MKPMPQDFRLGLEQMAEPIRPLAQGAADAVGHGFGMEGPLRAKTRQAQEAAPIPSASRHLGGAVRKPQILQHQANEFGQLVAR